MVYVQELNNEEFDLMPYGTDRRLMPREKYAVPHLSEGMKRAVAEGKVGLRDPIYDDKGRVIGLSPIRLSLEEDLAALEDSETGDEAEDIEE